MLPEITHLQFLILAICLNEEKSGREIRKELAAQGAKKTGPAFYQLMARLEDDHMVKGWYDQKVIDGQIIKERRYKITSGGERAWEQTRDFYAKNVNRGLQGGLSFA